MEAIDVFRDVIKHNGLEDCSFQLIEHKVGVNWRQKFPSIHSRLSNIKQGLSHDLPLSSRAVKGYEVLRASFDPASYVARSHRVLSVTSRFQTPRGDYRHLPMMNFHPDDKIGLNELSPIISAICGTHRGYLLETGRFWHYWGDWYLTEPEWILFNAQFLMPACIVSERYIGHSLHRGYNALRLTEVLSTGPKKREYYILSLSG